MTVHCVILNELTQHELFKLDVCDYHENEFIVVHGFIAMHVMSMMV